MTMMEGGGKKHGPITPPGPIPHDQGSIAYGVQENRRGISS